ncbi:MAG: HD-GYP domain-containing protein [Lachnospiraceae bacterium]|nr:HD-GYP domain-containing protein [Lachnospiraceae bacterium]
MKIDQAIVDSRGRELIVKGSVLDDFQIEYLREHGVGGIYIRFGEPDEEELSELERNLPIYTRELIQKSRVEDRSKVRLDQEVCKRVGEGIQFLFHNTDSESFLETTNNISGELVNAITGNKAVAIDINLIKVSDEYTFKHSIDVATMAMVIGQNYGLDRDELRELGIAGLLHDLGKSKIPIEVLNKPGKLDDDEFELMKQHSLFGFKILKEKNQFNENILKGVLQHHEKISGKGYPLGTTDEGIHKYAKIIAVADVYDALVTERPYKKAFQKREAVEMILAMTQDLDMQAMLSFLNCVILYPVDSIVTLSTGEPAKVVQNNSANCLRPTVVGLKTGKLYNLCDDINCASLVIL